MRQFLLVAAVTIVGFAAGSVAGVWFERHRPLPPPPVPFMTEFGAHGRGGPRHSPINRAQLVKQIEALQPQLEAYRHRMDEIDTQFDQELDPILSPDQRKKHADEMARRHHGPRPGPSNGEVRLLSDDQISNILHETPTRTVVWDVVIPFRLDMLTRQYKLDDDQREKVRALLRTRRDEILKLIDESPPPSVWLSRLSHMMEQLKAPAPDITPAPRH